MGHVWQKTEMNRGLLNFWVVCYCCLVLITVILRTKESVTGAKWCVLTKKLESGALNHWKHLGRYEDQRCVLEKKKLFNANSMRRIPPLQPPIFIQHFTCSTCNHSANFNDSPCNSLNLTPYGLITITDTLAVSMISSQKVSKDDFRSRAKSWR